MANKPQIMGLTVELNIWGSKQANASEVRHNLVDKIMKKATFTLKNRNCSLIKFRLTNS
jgi:hypothetical protein